MTTEFESFLQKWIWFVVIALIGACFAGIAALLREGQPVSPALVIRAAFVSTMVGAIFLAALWDSLALTRPAWLLAVTLCAGAGGGNLLDILARGIRRGLEKYTKDKLP